jgi:hypothetical protein
VERVIEEARRKKLGAAWMIVGEGALRPRCAGPLAGLSEKPWERSRTKTMISAICVLGCSNDASSRRDTRAGHRSRPIGGSSIILTLGRRDDQ